MTDLGLSSTGCTLASRDRTFAPIIYTNERLAPDDIRYWIEPFDDNHPYTPGSVNVGLLYFGPFPYGQNVFPDEPV